MQQPKDDGVEVPYELLTQELQVIHEQQLRALSMSLAQQSAANRILTQRVTEMSQMIEQLNGEVAALRGHPAEA